MRGKKTPDVTEGMHIQRERHIGPFIVLRRIEKSKIRMSGKIRLNT